jgi:hypothetical protein
MASRNIQPGEIWEASIWRAIREADFVLTCLSVRATAKRGFLQKEIRQALEIWKEKLEGDIYLIPVKLQECSIPDVLSRFQWVDLHDGYQKLLAAISMGMKQRGQEAMALTEPLAGPTYEGRKNADTPNRYQNPQNWFSFSIPAGWMRQKLVPEFLRQAAKLR